MTSFKLDYRNEIYALMEEFPSLCFEEIQSLALSLKIHGVRNEESVLSDKDYALLRNKIIMQVKSHTFNCGDEAYMKPKNTFDFDKELKSQDRLSIKELQREYSLKEAFIFEAINILGIKDIDGKAIETDMDSKLVYIYKSHSEQIVKKTHEINTIHANKKNLLLNGKITPVRKISMNELSIISGIDLAVLIQKARALKIKFIYNGDSYVNINSCMQIIRSFQKKYNSFTIVKKASSTVAETSIFEKLIIQGTLFFIDTSSLMNDDMPDVMNNIIIPVLKKHKKRVTVTDSVIYEIEEQMENVTNVESQRKAFLAQSILDTLAQDDLYQTPENYSVNKDFADPEIITMVTDLRLKYNICVITNDNSKKNGGGLSNSIMELQTSTCIRANSIKDISVLYVKNKKLVQYESNRDVSFTLHDKAPIRVLL